jgi:hypothetical protein
MQTPTAGRVSTRRFIVEPRAPWVSVDDLPYPLWAPDQAGAPGFPRRRPGFWLISSSRASTILAISASGIG